MAETRRIEQLANSMASRAEWPTPPFLVALSGGADSATLASLSQRQGAPTEAIHVHHGLADSDRLAGAAERIAGLLGIPMQVANIKVPDGPSVEAQARDARYAALMEAGVGMGSILTGHTKDDVAETVLINLIRGSGIRGLAGIPYHRAPNIYRPLLGVSRTETREYAALAGLDYVDDLTNFDRSIRRNWVRLEVVPLLQQANPSIVETLSRTADHLLADADALDRLIDQSSAIDAAPGGQIPIGDLVSSSDSVQRRLLADRIGTMRESPGVTSAELDRIVEVVAGVSVAAELEGGIRVTRNGPFLRISADSQ